MPGPVTGRILPHVHTLGTQGSNHLSVTVNPTDHHNNAALQTEAHAPFVKNAVDEVSPALTYVGYAAPGTDVSEPKWRIQRVSVSGTVTMTEYAETLTPPGSDDPALYGLYDKVWNDRASYVYK